MRKDCVLGPLNRSCTQTDRYRTLSSQSEVLGANSMRTTLTSSFPVARIFTVPLARFFLVCFTIFVVLDSFNQFFFTTWEGHGIAPYKHYRFTNLGTRNGSLPEHPGIDSFGLMSKEMGGSGRTDACLSLPLHGGKANFSTAGNSMTLSLQDAGSAMHDLWYLITSKDRPVSEDAVSSLRVPFAMRPLPVSPYAVL